MSCLCSMCRPINSTSSTGPMQGIPYVPFDPHGVNPHIRIPDSGALARLHDIERRHRLDRELFQREAVAASNRIIELSARLADVEDQVSACYAVIGKAVEMAGQPYCKGKKHPKND